MPGPSLPDCDSAGSGLNGTKSNALRRTPNSILFPFASAEVTPEGKEALAIIIEDIISRPYEKVWVRGHTDDVPVKRPETLKKFPHGNMHLSVERAVEVAALLVGQDKVEEAKLVVMGFGPNEPLVENSSPENRQKNRRVEILVTEPGH